MLVRDRVRGRAAVVLLVLSLPGCATASLWDREFPSWVPMERHLVQYVGTQVHEQDGELFVWHGEARGFVLEGGAGQASWTLHSPSGGDVACDLAEDPAFVLAARASVVDVRRLVGDEVQLAEAKVTLQAPAHGVAPAMVVDRESLTSEALSVLAETRHEGAGFAAEPWLRVPLVLRRACERVSGRYLRTVLGAGRPLYFVSYVFVGADGLPRFEPGTPAIEGLADARVPSWQALAQVALVLRVVRDGRDEYVRLAPEVLRLWATCELRDGWLRHESKWRLEARPASATQPGPDAVALFGAIGVHLVRSEARYRRTTHSRHAGWLAALLTPFAFAADLTVLLPYNIVLIGVRTSEGFDDEDVQWFGER